MSSSRAKDLARRPLLAAFDWVGFDHYGEWETPVVVLGNNKRTSKLEVLALFSYFNSGVWSYGDTSPHF
jgi:hypothetical protein